MTKGIRSSCIFDLERSIYCIIPNEIFNILERGNVTIKDFKNKFTDSDFETIIDYFDVLTSNNFIYKSAKKKQIISLEDDKFYTTYDVEDLIVDIDNIGTFYQIFRDKINLKKIETLQLRFYFKVSINVLEDFVFFLINLGFFNVELIFNHLKTNSVQDYIMLFNNNTIISKIVIMNYKINTQILQNYIFCISESLGSNKQCGIITPNLFSLNIRTFLSSKTCNSCLNKKISIDTNGNIKNCPSMPQSFGNIKDTTLEDALNHKDFKKYWNITKDQIDVCKDCEFRYICTDCRAYIEKPEDIYSKPLKCGYNPYTNEWSEWSTNPLKQKAIEYYGMQELVKKNNEV